MEIGGLRVEMRRGEVMEMRGGVEWEIEVKEICDRYENSYHDF
jgi:hypothetical protein